MDRRPGGCRKVASDFTMTMVVLCLLGFFFAAPLLHGCEAVMRGLQSITQPSEDGQPGSDWVK